MKVSVIITAHDRKRFLPYAINSVAKNMEIFPEEIELIVVKNFYDKRIDDTLKELGAINIFTEDKSLGIKQYLGIKKSSGDIIAFLEDDDMFSKNKLKVLFDVFSKFNIDFFHNDMIKIDENTLEPFNVDFNENMIEIVSQNEIINRKIIKKTIHKYHPELYNSCIAVSRQLAMSCLDGLKLADINTERFWFLCAVEKKKEIGLTNSKLTLYRLHSESSSQPHSKRFQEIRMDLFDRYLTSYLSMLDYFNDLNVKKLIYEMMILHRAHKQLYERDKILDKFRTIIDLVKLSVNPSSVYNEYSILTAISLLVSIFNIEVALKFLHMFS
ncbi:glycosyltransferase family 2 protein [Saccharolobus solfataricus]|uniref:Glycosyltransferase family 2 protein n=2 Tax=Saccharolobus solfataricus TaxID=2287 RepID=A0A0E3MCU0_SACSO|nr:glycosyltransferase family A protein [Saccharolobus solfataricus]AKA74672.1 glycosyltransferase family 2 protein [Saccharolobus solfataricus]AKA77366.1 glycosyltransferase family 2 protein [Saccharolobus solfataricus]AKA80057.1 glycosyltransferase family 2 protein [Saccharolobus solfataricus]AZF69135.1 glycosyltransferase family 2 protein [Saccharolobus solfataricus]AZF71755.1 glycosyltransferase family 2 protein [Saccharolobus solfataricus]